MADPWLLEEDTDGTSAWLLEEDTNGTQVWLLEESYEGGAFAQTILRSRLREF
jgi:hypothetical protein